MWWVDGYPMSVNAQSKLISAPNSKILRLLGAQRVSGDPLLIKQTRNYVHELRSPRLLVPNTFAFYHATARTNRRLKATQILLWPNQIGTGEKQFLAMYVSKRKLPDYGKSIPGILQYRNGGPIEIVPDQKVQEYISHLGVSLVPEYQKEISSGDPTKVNFHFYVVRPFLYAEKTHFVSVDGRLPKSAYRALIRDKYNAPKLNALVTSVIAMPDGKVLIPDVLLARMQNQAQVAALLSYAITSILQKQGYDAWPITRPHLMTSSAENYLFYTLRSEDEQLLRIGIREMYLAGYDIREAPFAWAVAQGKPVDNPVIDSKHPDKEIPRYAAYAFNYISQYYKDVDYSKLKRGRAEYQQFLQELYKADPSLPQAGRSQ